MLGLLPVQGRRTSWMIVGQGPSVLVVDAGVVVRTFYSHLYFLSSFFLSLWEMA